MAKQLHNETCKGLQIKKPLPVLITASFFLKSKAYPAITIFRYVFTGQSGEINSRFAAGSHCKCLSVQIDHREKGKGKLNVLIIEYNKKINQLPERCIVCIFFH